MSSMLRAALRAWYARRLLRLRSHRRPVDAPRIRSADPRADRVLILGNGVTHGWGVDSHRDALAGRLAQAVADRTGRGCEVEVVGAESMNARSARAWLGDRDLTGFDAVVVALGVNDALRRTPVADWAHGFSDLLAHLVPRLRPEAAAVVVGIPPLRALAAFDGLAARLGDGYRARLDAAAAYAAELAGVGHLDIPEFRTDDRGRLSAESVYVQLAARIAPELAASLVRTRPEPAPREPVTDPAGPAGQLVDSARRHASVALGDLAEKARRAMTVDHAAISLVDGDRLHHVTATGAHPATVPLRLTFCHYTVADGSPLVVPDARADERFAGNPHIDVAGIAFYAGYPLRAADGRVIGSLNVHGSRPREAAAVSLGALGELARQAEEELTRVALAT